MKKNDLEIIFENEMFIVVNKPPGLLSIPDREQKLISLKEILQQKFGNIFTVHRLDKETSGLILFAKNEAAHKYFSAQFEGRNVGKYYLGIVHGTPVETSGTIDAAIMEHPAKNGKMVVHQKGKTSITDYEVIEPFGRFSLLKFLIHTGRTHQIRVHAKHIGHPIVCDSFYGDGQPILLSSIKKKYKISKKEESEQPILNRLALHSSELILKDSEGNAFHLSAPLSKDMNAFLNQLRKN